jgi:hypothetical protein
MKIWKTEGVGCYVPARSEPEEIGEGSVGVSRTSGENSVDAGVGVVYAGAVLGGEFC